MINNEIAQRCPCILGAASVTTRLAAYAINLTTLRGCEVSLRPSCRYRLARERTGTNANFRQFAGTRLSLLRRSIVSADESFNALVGTWRRPPFRIKLTNAGNRVFGPCLRLNQARGLSTL